jgi:hypothetical protein
MLLRTLLLFVLLVPAVGILLVVFGLAWLWRQACHHAAVLVAAGTAVARRAAGLVDSSPRHEETNDGTPVSLARARLDAAVRLGALVPGLPGVWSRDGRVDDGTRGGRTVADADPARPPIHCTSLRERRDPVIGQDCYRAERDARVNAYQRSLRRRARARGWWGL